VTGALRLIAALWLIGVAVRSLAAPFQAVAEQGLPMSAVLPIAALNFTLGVFLLTGFMSRICGLLLACLQGWLMATLGISVVPIALALIGIHLMLSGSGAWAMDIYVQKMQDKVRSRESQVTSHESRSQ
jgi:membrane-bound ClpP family serine protease